MNGHRCQREVALVVCTIVAWLVSASSALAQTSDNRISFTSDRDGSREIYVMNPDGTGVQQLTSNGAQNLQPTWSPDKQQIAFVSNQDGDFGIHVMNADGSNLHRIAGGTGAFYEYPSWSPDSTQIVYSSDEERSFDLYVIHLGTGKSRHLTNSEEYETEPSWSPDGSQIVYLKTVDGVYEMFVISINGGESRALLQSSGTSDFFSPRWSPDGRSLAYAVTQADERGSISEIYIRDLDNSSERLLVSIEDTFIGSISWSADGQELIYASQNRSTHTWIISRIHSDGENTRVLTSADFNSETASWFSPPLIDSAVQLIPVVPATEDVITYARINTRYGETLNFRAQTSTDATILEELPFGSVVSVISQSVDAGGIVGGKFVRQQVE